MTTLQGWIIVIEVGIIALRSSSAFSAVTLPDRLQAMLLPEGG